MRTKDLEMLLLLCKRFRSDDSIIIRGELQSLAKSAVLDMLIEKVRMTNGQFDSLCSRITLLDEDVESQILSSHQQIESSELYWLAVACDLKRTLRGDFVSLDEFIVNLYSKLYLNAGFTSVPGKPVSQVTMSRRCLARAAAMTKAVTLKSTDDNMQ